MNPEQNHWSERGRATSVANADALGRPRRAVRSFDAITGMPDLVPNSLPNWIAHVFDHPVTDPAWHWDIDAPQWEDSPEHMAMCIASAFERSGELLAPFSDKQNKLRNYDVTSSVINEDEN